MYLNREAISLAEAQKRLAQIALTPRLISKKIRAAHGYVLAEDILAPFPIPFFRRSGYDGYGVLAEDDFGYPKSFEVVENIGAGDDFKQTLSAGQCVRIMTGAKVPDEVAKVIMLEDSLSLEGKRVQILKSSAKSNISEIGDEVTENERVLPRGCRINAGVVSVLAAFGLEEVKVFDHPKVAIVATGSELTSEVNQNRGKIYNSNGPLLAGLAEENDAVVTGEYQLADDLDQTRALITRLSAENDLVITTGGVSVGDFDFMAVLAQESNCLFNKLAMRPGSPTTAFTIHDRPVIALSGNPSACFTGFWFFAEPLIRRFQGQESLVRKSQATLIGGHARKNNYDRYLNGVSSEKGVSLTGRGQSSELASLFQSNCFYKIPHYTVVQAGEEVDTWLIPVR